MILVDYSALAFQSIFSASSMVKPRLRGKKYVTEDFIYVAMYRIFETLFDVQQRFSAYGDVVLCLDGRSATNWRKKIYPLYKSSRASAKAESKINFSEVFSYLSRLEDAIEKYLPYKMVGIGNAEGDDVVMTLARTYNSSPVMIVSSDKDMIQVQRYGNIEQYSLLTQKFITPETKHGDNMDEWLTEHVILGDDCDDVPRVVDGLTFSDAFQQYLDDNNIDVKPVEVANTDFLLRCDYDVWTLDKHGNPKTLDVFKRPRFGISTFKKELKKYGSLDAWLDSVDGLRTNYERNKNLVLDTCIPDDVVRDILVAYKKAGTDYDYRGFKQFLDDNNLSQLEMIIPFTSVLSVEDFF